MNDTARLVICILGAFLLASFLGGILLLLLAPVNRISDALITAMIVAPMSNALGVLGGLLARTEKVQDGPGAG